jgi:hypothetical protein
VLMNVAHDQLITCIEYSIKLNCCNEAVFLLIHECIAVNLSISGSSHDLEPRIALIDHQTTCGSRWRLDVQRSTSNLHTKCRSTMTGNYEVYSISQLYVFSFNVALNHRKK